MAKPAPNRVTPAASDAFAMLMRKWQGELNLYDWRIERSPKPAGKNSLAEVTSMSLKDRLAIYKLGEDFGDSRPVTEQSLEEIACHEMLHVLLNELIEYAKDPHTKPEDLEAVEHRVINVLVRLLVPEN